MPYSGSASVNPRAARRRSRSAGVVDGPSHHVVGTEPRSRRRRVELVDPCLDRGVVAPELGAQDVVEPLERPPAGDPRGVGLDSMTVAPGSRAIAESAATSAASDSVKPGAPRRRR